MHLNKAISIFRATFKGILSTRLTRVAREVLTSLFVPMLNEPKDAPPWLVEGVETPACRAGVLCTGCTNLGPEGSRGVSCTALEGDSLTILELCF